MDITFVKKTREILGLLEKRQKLIEFIINRSPVTVGEVQKYLECHQSQASVYLSELCRNKLIDAQKQGKHKLYSPNITNLKRVLKFAADFTGNPRPITLVENEKTH